MFSLHRESVCVCVCVCVCVREREREYRLSEHSLSVEMADTSRAGQPESSDCVLTAQCVCVCVCVCERDREKRSIRKID